MEKFDYNKTYYKVMNENENHHGYQYKDGLNIDTNEWNDEWCKKGGFYFTDIENIFRFIDYGCYVREVRVPENEKLVSIEEYKYKAHSIVLGKKMDLFNVDTIEYLVEQGADIHICDDCALRYASEYGHLDIVEYLIEHGADVHACNDWALCYASEKGHLDIVKYLVEQGADIHACEDYALCMASEKGYLDIVKYLESCFYKLS